MDDTFNKYCNPTGIQTYVDPCEDEKAGNQIFPNRDLHKSHKKDGSRN